MSIVKSKAKAAPKPKRGKLTAKEQFHHCWKQIEKFERKLAAKQVLQQELMVRFDREVRPLEVEQFATAYRKVERLIGFYEKKSLSGWQREELGDWIGSELNFLLSHPFRNEQDPEQLLNRFHRHLQSLQSDEMLKADDTLDQARAMFVEMFDSDLGLSDEELIACLREPDTFQSVVAEHLERMRAEEAETDEAWLDDEADEDDFAFFGESGKPDAAQVHNQELSLSLASMKSLYKKLALALHPDRELDAVNKLEKSQQMTQLLTAWKEKDIYTLLSLADRHLNDKESPLTEENLKELLPLLQQKKQELESRYHDRRGDNDISSLVYRKFSGHSKYAMEMNFSRHLEMLKRTLLADEALLAEATTLKALKPILAERWERRCDTINFNPFLMFD